MKTAGIIGWEDAREMIRRLKKMVKSRKGATLPEYVLLVSLIAVVAMVAIVPMGETIRDKFAAITAAIK